MLAVKSALALKDETPLLVFDEIDSNVGGEIARAVGRKMRELGQRHQVISITHFPQVASLADHHFLVEKGTVSNRTISRLREVVDDQRIAELVRMLGGGQEEARAHAETLLKI
jgi:DNA repair protein RecN (Recombination protein N)